MEYAYATCILNESGEEINEQNLVAVLEAAGCQVQESRVKAIVAALEDVDIGGITAVDVDEVGGPDEGDSADRRTDGSVNQGRDGGGNADPTAGSELTAIDEAFDSGTQPDAAASTRNGASGANAQPDGTSEANAQSDDASGMNAQSDATSGAGPDTGDDGSTPTDAESSGRPDDGV